MKLCVLASGSSGNCTFVSAGATRILIDAGLSGRETERRLTEIGEDPADISAICLTHEHGDHIAGLGVLHARFGMKVYANGGTIEALDDRQPKLGSLEWMVFSTGAAFKIGGLTMEPFSVSHDAYEPVGFIVSAGGVRAGIATDIGVGTHLVRERLRGCNALVIESNHDENLLAGAMRPWYLKQRIAGRQGHMSNQGAAKILADVAGPDLFRVFLAHLSNECNRPELAQRAAVDMLRRKGSGHVKVEVAVAERVSGIWSMPGQEEMGIVEIGGDL